MLGERIKLLRTAQKMSQVELAQKLNISKQSVSNWENNNILPSIEMVKKMAIFFSCSTDYLLEMDNRKTLLEASSLTLEQETHIQQLVADIQQLNSDIQQLNIELGQSKGQRNAPEQKEAAASTNETS